MVTGWQLASHMRTSLVTDALAMAVTHGHVQPGAVFHSDRSAQYTSAGFTAFCSAHGVLPSTGRTGVCPLTGQSLGSCRSVTRRAVQGCLRGGDGGATPVRHERGGLLAAA
jgi:transposase InsO family protein